MVSVDRSSGDTIPLSKVKKLQISVFDFLVFKIAGFSQPDVSEVALRIISMEKPRWFMITSRHIIGKGKQKT
jgi:hypothetical protein